MICKTLGLFVNPLTAEDKYILLNRGNLFQHFRVQLSQKRKILSQFFFKIESKFKKFQKKIEKIFLVSDIVASENVAIDCLCYEGKTCLQQGMG